MVLVAVQRIRAGIVPPACVHISVAVALDSAPDDHLTAGPYCSVTVSAIGRVSGAGGCPTIRAGIISPAGVEIRASVSAPHNHFAASPHCAYDRFGQMARWWCW